MIGPQITVEALKRERLFGKKYVPLNPLWLEKPRLRT